MKHIALKVLFLTFFIFQVTYSMEWFNPNGWGQNLQIPLKIYKPTLYCIQSLIYGEKTDIALATATTLATLIAYPLKIITGKTALTLQALLLAKHVITFRLFLNNSDSKFLLKETAITELCHQYSLFLFGVGIISAVFITSADIANRLSSKKHTQL